MSPTSLVLLCLSLSQMAAATEPPVQGEGCSAKTCGSATISEPFGLVVPEQANETACGRLGFKVTCANNTPYLGYYRVRFQILDIFYGNGSLLVVDIHKLNDLNSSGHKRCRIPTINTSAKVGVPFSISPVNLNLIFYNCTKAPASADQGLVETKCGNSSFVHIAGNYNGLGDYDGYSLEGCKATVVPVLGAPGKVNASSYEELISDGFLLTWQQPPAGRKRMGRNIILIVLTSAAATLLFPCIYVLICYRKGKILQFLLRKKTSTSTERNYEAMIVSYGSLSPKRYMYSEVMKITSSRNNQLGKGGYGVVFKGRLDDGRLVAVKFLHDCKGNGGEFVNEVMSIGRTSHVNIVSLFGFCSEGSKRALIYEYMSNGSLDKYIY